MCFFSQAFINGSFGLVGVAVGGWIGYLFSLRANQTFSAREAANNLRSNFAPLLAAVRRDQQIDAVALQLLLEPSADTIAIETEKFRFYINRQDLSAYDKACGEYQAIARIRAMDYKALGGKEPFKVFEDRVNAILHFAHP